MGQRGVNLLLAVALLANPGARRAPLPWMAAAGLLLIVASALGFVHCSESRPPAPKPTRFEITTPPLANGGEFYMAISPDERRVAFTALGGDGENRLWIRDMDRVEVRVIPGTERARACSGLRSADGKEVIYLSPDNRMMSVAVTTSGNTIQANLPKALFSIPANARLGRAEETQGWDMTGNAQRFLLNLTPVDTGSNPITILQNWRSALKPR